MSLYRQEIPQMAMSLLLVGVQEMELNAQIKHCSAKCEKGQGQHQSTALGRVHHSGCVYEVFISLVAWAQLFKASLA